MKIPFNKSYVTKKDIENVKISMVKESLEGGEKRSSNRCIEYIEKNFSVNSCLLTTSCTSALDLSALILQLKPGDEIIMPSYTFVSTANAFVLRGCKPVFVDIGPDDLNLNMDLVEEAITKKTKALVVVHYAGIACEMSKAIEICKKHNLFLIEDAAQAIGSKYKDKFLGSLGDLGTLSFHGTKNITCGEGGALLINKNKYLEKARIIFHKGTNRHNFATGKASKYNWRNVGSSFTLSNFSASLLIMQLKNHENINKERLKIWVKYNKFFSSLKDFQNKYRLLKIPSYATHNGHLFSLIFRSKKIADNFSKLMRSEGYEVSKHYVALHSSPYGKKVSRTFGNLLNTKEAEDCSVRIPLWPGIKPDKMLEFSSKIIKRI